jgi:hypothetical protein
VHLLSRHRTGPSVVDVSAVRFEVRRRFDDAPQRVWAELVDWTGHAAWVPATRVRVDPGDPVAVGATFTAWTGFGPLALEDRMEVATCAWEAETLRGTCEILKRGPVLGGWAGFTVSPDARGAVVQWVEDLSVPHLPPRLAPIVAWLGARGLRYAMRRLARLLSTRPSP